MGAILAVLTIALSVAGFTLGYPWGLVALLGGTGCLVYAGRVSSSFGQYTLRPRRKLIENDAYVPQFPDPVRQDFIRE